MDVGERWCALLESVLGATLQEFESPILRHAGRVAGGIAAPAPTDSVRKPLGLYGSCHPDHQTRGTDGVRAQCANMRGYLPVIPRQHTMAFFLACSRLYFLRIQRTR